MMNYFKNRRKLCTALFALGSVVSGVFTLILLTSNSVSMVSKLLAAGMTIIFEFGKFIAFVESKNEKYTQKTRRLLFNLWLFTTILSVFASLGYMLNESNQNQNETLKTSNEYRLTQDKESRLKSELVTKEKLLEDAVATKNKNIQSTEQARVDNVKLTSDYNSKISTIQSRINSKNEELAEAGRNKWTTTQTRIRSEIDGLKSQLNQNVSARDKLTTSDKSSGDQANIDKMNAEITTINNQLNGISYKGITGELPVNGYLELFSLIASVLSCSVKTVSIIFNLILTSGFELLIVSFYHLSRLQGNTENFDDETYNDRKPKRYDLGKISDMFSTKKPAREIGFRKDNYSESPTVKQISGHPSNINDLKATKPEKTISNETLKLYLNYIYKNANESRKIPGYQKTALDLSLDVEMVRKLKAYCEHLKIVESSPQNKRTTIIKPKNEVGIVF